MNIFVELTAVVGSIENEWYRQQERARRNTTALASGRAVDLDEDAFDEDDLEREINPDGEPDTDTDEGAAPDAPTIDPNIPVPAGMYYSVDVFENDIREIYARRHAEGRPGSRIVYRSGAPRIVKETLEEVRAKFKAARRASLSTG
jgi:hypothetical protein